MHGKLLVFISSTSDLKAERQAIKSMLAESGGLWEPYLYEDEPARSQSPEERCREMVEQSDVFVGILGAEYGTPYPPPGDGGSIVEWEFETARQRPDLGLMAVMVKRLPTGQQVDSRQQTFIRRVRDFRALWCKEYASPTDLSREVSRSLMRWSTEIVRTVRVARQERRERLRPFLAPIAIGSVLIVAAIFLLNAMQLFAVAPAALIALCAFEVALLLAIILTLLL